MSKNFLPYFLTIVLFYCSDTYSSPSMNCIKNGRLLYSEMKAQVIRASSYCFEDRTNYLADIKCHSDHKCEAQKRRKLKSIMPKTRGNPMHFYCHEAGGIPKISKFWTGTAWRPVVICDFTDGSFIGLDYMIKYLIDFEH